MGGGGVRVLLGSTSGSGKSTIMALVQRLYEAQEGSILLDGMDITELAPEFLRSQIGIVSQEPTLFHDTVANNIRYGRPDASMEEVQVGGCKLLPW